MYTLGQTVFAQVFATTFMSMTFRPKLFTEEAPMVPLIKAIAAKRSKDGVFSVEKSRRPMRHVERARPPKSRPLCNVLFHDKLGATQHYAREFSGRVPFDVLD
jgi:hypothetical protein